jgi:zinc transport system substrate-binding protein
MKRSLASTVAIAVCLVLAAAGQAIAAPQAGKSVVVSILPQAYFVDRVSGGDYKAVVLVGPGQDPHSYEPTPRQMAELSKASAWFTIGVEFENALAPKVRSLYPSLPVVDTSEGVQFRQLEAHHHEGEAEGEEHEESGRDPHVWLGRQAAKTIAAHIRDELAALDPANSSKYAKNYESFAADADKVFTSIARDLEPMRGQTVFVYHPAFGYFLDEFGLKQEAVETGGKEPTQKALTDLIAEAKEDGAKVVFVQKQFPTSAAKTVAKSIGGVVEAIDALAPDWLANIGRIGAALRKAAR